jgi:hypothetical protein
VPPPVPSPTPAPPALEPPAPGWQPEAKARAATLTLLPELGELENAAFWAGFLFEQATVEGLYLQLSHWAGGIQLTLRPLAASWSQEERELAQAAESLLTQLPPIPDEGAPPC